MPRWPFVLAAAGALGLLAWSAVRALRTTSGTLDLLLQAGWAPVLGGGGVPSFLACAFHATCREAFARSWASAYPVALPVAALATLWIAAILNLLSGRGREQPPGSARWATGADLRPYLRDRPDDPRRGYLGLLRNGRVLRPPESLRCAHTLVLGATGARKSTAYHKPNLVADALDGVSVVVIDLKYPDARSGFLDLVPLFAREGFDVQPFLPYDPVTLRLPLLAGADTPQGAADVADLLVPATRHEGAAFYKTQQRMLLTGLLLGAARDGQASPGRVLALLKGGRLAVQRYAHAHADREVRDALAGFFEFDAKSQISFLNGLKGDLTAFDDARLDKATTASSDARQNIDLRALGRRPTLLYVGLPQEHLLGTRAGVLLRLVKRALDHALLATANEAGGRLPHPVSVYLDEFASLGPLPNVGENFATMRSRRVAYHLSLQNRAQGEALYGRDAFRSFITNNVQQVLVFPRSLKFEDAEYVSRALGVTTAWDTAVGTSREGVLAPARRSRVRRQVARPLLPVEEMARWPETSGILFPSGGPPARVILPRLDESRAEGVRNPLHRTYAALTSSSSPASILRAILRARTGEGPSGSESEASPSPVTVEPSGADSSTRTTPPPPMNPSSPEADLRAWFDTLSDRDVPVVRHTNPKSGAVTKVSVARSSLPAGLAPALAAWKEQGWVKVTTREIGLVGQGLAVLGPNRLKASSDRVSVPTVDPQDVAKLRAFVRENGRLLQGHPDRPERPDEAPVGTYRACTVLLPKDHVESLVGSVPAAFRRRRRGPKGAQHWVVAVPERDLTHYPTLRTWCEANASRLKGHPAFDPKRDEAGVVLPETVALPAALLEELLGRLPAGAIPTRPRLGGVRRYLLAVELGPAGIPPRAPADGA